MCLRLTLLLEYQVCSRVCLPGGYCIRVRELVQINRISETDAVEIPIIGLGTSYKRRSCQTKKEGRNIVVRKNCCNLH